MYLSPLKKTSPHTGSHRLTYSTRGKAVSARVREGLESGCCKKLGRQGARSRGAETGPDRQSARPVARMPASPSARLALFPYLLLSSHSITTPHTHSPLAVRELARLSVQTTSPRWQHLRGRPALSPVSASARCLPTTPSSRRHPPAEARRITRHPRPSGSSFFSSGGHS